MSATETASAPEPLQKTASSQVVVPLPIGSGGSNGTKQGMIDINQTLVGMSVTADANTKFDTPVDSGAATPAKTKSAFTNPTSIEPFCSEQPLSEILIMIGCVFIVYGIVAK